MTKVKMTVLALLLAPAAASADMVSIDWSGQITSYGASAGSGQPQILSSNDVSGDITYDTSVFPPADSGNPPGVYSYTAGDLFQASVNWQGGLFQCGIGGGDGSDNVTVDTGNDQFNVSGLGSYVDGMGDTHSTAFTFGLQGVPALLTDSLGLGPTGFSGIGSGGGSFADANSAGEGFAAGYQLEHVDVTVRKMAAPEIDPASAMSGLTLLAGALAVTRGRRRS